MKNYNLFYLKKIFKELGEEYNEDYFERGLQAGVSNYQNYRWMPDFTIPMAMTIIDYLKLTREHKILDFGCAKGYLVKALRMLYRKAWGVDISKYAIDNCHPDVSEYCVKMGTNLHRSLPKLFDYCIAKDVFEHIDEGGLKFILSRLNCKRIFAVIPLGDSEYYRAPLNNCDKTHQICANEYWWITFFKENGWEIEDFKLQIPGIKDAYYEKYPDAHGFFLAINSKIASE